MDAMRGSVTARLYGDLLSRGFSKVAPPACPERRHGGQDGTAGFGQWAVNRQVDEHGTVNVTLTNDSITHFARTDRRSKSRFAGDEALLQLSQASKTVGDLEEVGDALSAISLTDADEADTRGPRSAVPSVSANRRLTRDSRSILLRSSDSRNAHGLS